MANILYGALATQLAGSVGGVTFQKAGSSLIVRKRPQPMKPKQVLQKERQAALGNASAHWVSAGSFLQGEWISWAASVTLQNSLGQTYQPTGQQAYIWGYIQHTDNGVALPGTCPTLNGTPAEHVPVFSYSASKLYIASLAPSESDLLGLSVSVSYPDSKRSKCRMPRFSRTLLCVGGAAPIAPIADFTGMTVLTTYQRRVFVTMRFTDTNLRPSLLYTYFYDIP
jgi:hypothetical protein